MEYSNRNSKSGWQRASFHPEKFLLEQTKTIQNFAYLGYSHNSISSSQSILIHTHSHTIISTRRNRDVFLSYNKHHHSNENTKPYEQQQQTTHANSRATLLSLIWFCGLWRSCTFLSVPTPV